MESKAPVASCCKAHLQALTICAQHQRGGGALNTALSDRVGHHAGVVAHVRWFHLSNVQVPRLL